MTIDRAIEILDPEHRECYDGMDEVKRSLPDGHGGVGADTVGSVQ